MADSIQTAACAEHVASLDNQLSQRFIALDPAGYFLIRIDHGAHELIVEHYRNDVDDRGRATDPDTGEVLSCRGGAPRSADAVLRAPTAKAMAAARTALAGHRAALAPSNIIGGSPNSQRKASPPPEAAAPASAPAVDPEAWAEEEESLAVAKRLPNDRIVIETDAPWCGIKASHPGHGFVGTTWPAKDKKKRAAIDSGETVKDRSEPCHVAQVLEVIAAVKGEDADELAEIYRRNALRLFFPEEYAALG